MMYQLMIVLAETPAKKLETGLGKEIGSVFLLLVCGVSVYYFMQRKFTAFIGFALFSMAVGVLVFNPGFVKTLGENGFTWLFEAFLH